MTDTMTDTMTGPTPQPHVLIVYYSATGNTRALAHALAEGAQQAGADVRVRRVAETAPPDAIARNPRWTAYLQGEQDDLAVLDDLTWAHGLALGSPTRFGGPAAQLKAFLDTTGGLWAQGRLARLVGTTFTSASTRHGGLESTILAINNVYYHWGAVVLPLGYPDRHVQKVTGNPYGASFVDDGSGPGEAELTTARTQGARLARVAAALRPLLEEGP